MQAPRSRGRQGGISGDSLYDIRKGPTFWSLSSMLAVHHSQDSSPTPYVQIPLSSPALALPTEAHRRDDDFRHEPSPPSSASAIAKPAPSVACPDAQTSTTAASAPLETLMIWPLRRERSCSPRLRGLTLF
jgi:hypothetical protein